FFAAVGISPFLFAGGQPNEILNGFGSLIVIKLHLNVARARVDRGVGRQSWGGRCKIQKTNKSADYSHGASSFLCWFVGILPQDCVMPRPCPKNRHPHPQKMKS